MGDADTLPQAHIKRIVKAKLAELTAGEGDQKREVSVQKEALSAFAESARIFIHFLTATANEVCHESKRLTINADDVLKAIEDVEFHEFVEPLREALAGALAGGFGRACGGKRCGAAPALTRAGAAARVLRSFQGCQRREGGGQEDGEAQGGRRRGRWRRGRC